MEAKKMFDIFISYSARDREWVEPLIKEIQKCGVSVYSAEENITSGTMAMEAIVEAIRSSRVFVAIVTEHMMESMWCKKELEIALTEAKNRSKIILPVCFSFDVLKNEHINYYLGIYQFLKATGKSEKDIRTLAGRIAEVVHLQNSENSLYELLSEYSRVGAKDKVTDLLCKIVSNKANRVPKIAEVIKRREEVAELFPFLEKLSTSYDFDYSQEGKARAHRKLHTLTVTSALLEKMEEFQGDDLFYLSAAIRLLFYEREIGRDAADAITGGDVSDGIVNAYPQSEYIKKQAPYKASYERELEAQQGWDGDGSRYSEAERKFIKDTENYMYETGTWRVEKAPRPEPAEEKTTEDELLCSVASFMREGNKILDIIGEARAADEFLKCLLTSYERLKSYCEVIGEKEICAQCIDRIVELKQKLSSAGSSAETSEKAEHGIKSLLGLTVPRSGKYDVFISHKKEDTDIASDMYHFLKRNMKEPFFDKLSLPEMAESQYRKAIMQALDGSTHFVVIFSDLSYLESDWVKLEMEIFQSEIDEGRKESASFIMVVTNDVYEEIMKSNKTLIPLEYRRCEIIRVEDYKKTILNYFDK